MEHRTCVQCGKPFTISHGEQMFLERKGLELPKRCQACRQKNKTEKPKRELPPQKPKASGGKNNVGAISKTLFMVAIAVMVGVFLSKTGLFNDPRMDESGFVLPTAEGEEGSIFSFDWLESLLNGPRVDETGFPIAESEAQGESEAPAPAQENVQSQSEAPAATISYTFRNDKLLQDHFQKHGSEFAYFSAAEYERGANVVIQSPDALFKEEKEDGDGVYYVETTNELVILSKDGYIRTYFRPNDGLDYFNRQ